MGTTSDKLNYLVGTKDAIRQAIIGRTVPVPDVTPFRDYANKIQSIPTGGGFSDTYTITAQTAEERHNSIIMHALFIRGGARIISVYLNDVLQAELTSTIAADANGYQKLTYNIPDSMPAGIYTVTCSIVDTSVYIADLTLSATFSLLGYLNTTDDMTNMGFTSDDGTTTFTVDTLQCLFKYAGVAVTSLIVSGNTYIGLNTNVEHIKVNRRDTYIATYYVQYIVEAGIKVLKLRWEGWSPYNNRTDAYRYAWEIFFIENGDIFLNLAVLGSSTNFTGTFSMLDTPYNLSMEQPMVAFYRQNTAGSAWTVVNEAYDISKHVEIE